MKKKHWYTCVKSSTGKSCKCGLQSLNLDHEHFEDRPDGVYVIWHNGSGDRIVKVGQGNLWDRFSKHRKDPKILKFKDEELMVSWMELKENELNGIERYLGDSLKPIVAERFPDVDHIEVEIPEFIPEPNKKDYKNNEN